MDEISTVIATLGFPIATACYLLIDSYKQRQEHREDAQKWCDAINRNTAVIERLLDNK